MDSIIRSRNSGKISVAVALSYVFDWVVLIIAAILGAIFSEQTPNKRPFSVVDPSISFPHVTKEKISTALAGVLSFGVPAIVILIITLTLVPGPTVPKSVPKSLIWKRKLWELHASWLGLCLSLALSFVVTNGMKNLFGKPRPDLISRCNPDLANIHKYSIGGASTAETVVLVSAAICQQTDKSILNDGFRSYPSGHSSFAAGGLIYLSLFLASKLALTVPFLAPRPYTPDHHTSYSSAFPSRTPPRSSPLHHHSSHRRTSSDLGAKSYDPSASIPSGHDDKIIASRNQAAAPPLYLLLIALIPTFLAVYIASTRFSDFRHHGFDILFGFFIGTVAAIFAFRFYHLPISQGAGWSWGPRSKDRAFWAGVGVGSYVQSERSPVGGLGHHREISDVERDAGGMGNGMGNANVRTNFDGHDYPVATAST
jgi:membrane-associated phospholipid phosphatase